MGLGLTKCGQQLMIDTFNPRCVQCGRTWPHHVSRHRLTPNLCYIFWCCYCPEGCCGGRETCTCPSLERSAFLERSACLESCRHCYQCPMICAENCGCHCCLTRLGYR